MGSAEPPPRSSPGPVGGVPVARGAASRGPAVATCSGCTSPRCRETPPTGVNSSIGTRYGATGRAVNSIAPEGDLCRSRWWNQASSSRSGMSSALVVETPAGLGAGQRGPGRHLRAVADEGDLGAAHQLVRGTRAHRRDVRPHPLEGLQGERQPGAGLRRGHVVVDEAAQLVLDLGLRRAVGVAQRAVDQLVRLAQLVGRQFARVRRVARRVRARQVAEDERADHVVVRHAGQVAGGVEAGDRGAGVVVHPYPRGGVAAAQADLGDVHLDVVGAVVVAAARVEGAARRALRRVQDRLQRGDGLLREMAELQVHRPPVAGHLRGELGHHLARPVVGVDEALAVPVDLVAAEGVGDVGAGGAVVVLDQRVDLEALDAGQFGARVVGHGVAVTGVGGVLVGAVEVAGRGQAEPSCGSGRQDHGAGADRHERARAGVERRPRPPPGPPPSGPAPASRRFSMRIRSRISRRRNCRYRTFLTSLPSGIGST